MRIYIKNDDLTMYDFFKFCKSATFRTKLIKILKNVKYKEYYLKFPMTSYRTSSETPFYIDVKKAPSTLTRKNLNNDTKTFDFKKCSLTTKSISFLSKSKRSYIVVPCPNKKMHRDSGHIAQFMKSAKMDYIQAFWKEIGKSFFSFFKSDPNKTFQLLTHGHDVYWLHAKFVFM